MARAETPDWGVEKDESLETLSHVQELGEPGEASMVPQGKVYYVLYEGVVDTIRECLDNGVYDSPADVVRVIEQNAKRIQASTINDLRKAIEREG